MCPVSPASNSASLASPIEGRGNVDHRGALNGMANWSSISHLTRHPARASTHCRYPAGSTTTTVTRTPGPKNRQDVEYGWPSGM